METHPRARTLPQGHGPARRVEHALFAVVLVCVGSVWVGALLAEAVQAL